MATGFDIATLEQADTSTIQLINPNTDEPIPGVTATIYGQDSAQGRAATAEAQARYVDIARKNRGKVTPEQTDRLELQKFIKITKSIDGLASGGKPFTDVAEIFAKVPAFYDQIRADFADRKLFTKA